MLKAGKKVGGWTLESRYSKARTSGKLDTMWNCVCTCGTKRAVRADNLRDHRTRSCGCESTLERRVFQNIGFESKQ